MLVKKKSHLVLASIELRPVAEHNHSLKSLPARSRLVEGVARLVLGRVRLHNLVVEPHVGDGHSVLGEGARLVRADARGGAQGLHRLQVLHKAVLCPMRCKVRQGKPKEQRKKLLTPSSLPS